jgi:glycosyltransferase involved in cell wall biosynthesis
MFHLIYLRFVFPLPNEPGPKRPLEIGERYSRQGNKVTVITSNCNFMTGAEIIPGGGLFAKQEENSLRYIRVKAVRNYRESMKRRLSNYALFTLLSLGAGIKAYDARYEKDTIIFVDISPPFAALGGYLLAKLRSNSHLVLEITDLPESVFELGMFSQPFWKKITDWFFKKFYQGADHIITLTPGAQKHLEDLGISGQKITTVTNWIDASREVRVSAETGEEIRSRQGWQDKFVLMYAGGHGKAYDLMTLIKAGELLKDNQKLKIVFMGTGEHKGEYQEYCRARQLAVCEFINPVPRNLLAVYLASADACINLFYPGDFWNKVIGHKIFDYFEAARPVIFVGDGDTAEIIRNAQGGIVVPPGNPLALSRAITAMMENRAETSEMGQRGYNYLRSQYDKEKILGRLDRVFQNFSR